MIVAEELIRAKIEREMRMLIADAEDYGFVVEIRLEPQHPLAMGNHRMVGEVRPCLDRIRKGAV